MKRTKWIERKFTFGLPEGWLPNVLERLRGTEVRIKEIVSGLMDGEASYKPDGKWSIKEHIGHLSDLEDLHEGRIDDFLAHKPTLRAADMGNQRTHQANHNGTQVSALILAFSTKRNQFIHRLAGLDDETQSFQALHPRLNAEMRPVDMAFFTAEHDDHHLASMREIVAHLRLEQSG